MDWDISLFNTMLRSSFNLCSKEMKIRFYAEQITDNEMRLTIDPFKCSSIYVPENYQEEFNELKADEVWKAGLVM